MPIKLLKKKKKKKKKYGQSSIINGIYSRIQKHLSNKAILSDSGSVNIAE